MLSHVLLDMAWLSSLCALACRLQNKLRVFKLLTLQDGYAYLSVEDYQGIIARITQLQQVPIHALSFAVSSCHAAPC